MWLSSTIIVVCLAFVRFTYVDSKELLGGIFGSRIINGATAYKGQFPWQAAIFITLPTTTNLCGGALISNKWVLTAGHCVAGAEDFVIALGSNALTDEDSNRITVASKQAILHENYVSTTLANDIALIELSETVTFTDYIKPVQLAEDALTSGTIVTVSGWGLTSDSSDGASQNLNYVTMETVSDETCKNYYPRVGDGVVCASARGALAQGTCQGDSGGPLVTNPSSNPVHVGVVSFGNSNGCESVDPQGFTRTAYYRNWIRDKSNV